MILDYQLDIIKFDKPTHVINTSMSCIDLIFCTNQSVISNHGVDVSIFDKCHHNIIYGKINIRVPLPSTYVQGVWEYEEANIDNIKKAISTFDWNKAFENLSVDEKVDFLNKTLFNIFRIIYFINLYNFINIFITFQTKKLNAAIGNSRG